MANPRPTFDGAPFKPDETVHRRLIADAITGIMRGKTNCVLDVTLAANVTATTITDDRLGYFTGIYLDPLTANAAGAMATTYCLQANRLKGSFTLTHANAATTDRTFRVAIFG